MLIFQDEALKEKLEEETGTYASMPEYFHTFSDLEKDVNRQIAKIKSHPLDP